MTTPTYPTDRATQEEHLVGLILINAVLYDYAHLRTFVRPEHFQDKRNRLVWEAFERLYTSGTTIVFRSVCQELAAANTLQDAGGGYRLLALINSTPSDANPIALVQALTAGERKPLPEPVQHTPTPWIASEEESRIIEIIAPWSDAVKAASTETYGDYRGAMIAQIAHQGDQAPVVTHRQAKANAAFIVRACNCHDELVQLIEEQITAMSNMPMNDINYAGLAWAKRARTIIANAKGGM